MYAFITLADDKINVNKENSDGTKALHFFIKWEKTWAYDGLLNDQHIAINLCDRSGNAALHLAVEMNNTGLLDTLIGRSDIKMNMAIFVIIHSYNMPQ